MSNRTWRIILPLTVALGLYIGYQLAKVANLHPYRLLNIIGLFYSLLAVFVLSEVLIANPHRKKVCVEKLAPVLLWAHVIVPIGVALGAGLAWLVGRGPSAYILAVFAFVNFLYMSVVGSILEQIVVLPRLFTPDLDSRWRYFGLILLSTGLLFQLISAVREL